jgi:hypothetical protein
MPLSSRYAVPVMLLVAMLFATVWIAVASSHQTPSGQTQAPTAVTTTGATLQGVVNPAGETARYWFQYGPTAAYGRFTAMAQAGKGDAQIAVSAAVTGLQPQTTYHVRIVVWAHGTTLPGADVTFATPAATTPTGAAPPPASAAPSPLPGTELVPAPAAPPALAVSVHVAPASGTVLVRVPGATRAAALADGASVPVGSIIDTRAGTVKLQSALPAGRTQTGTFHGGVFEVRQPAGGHGMTDLVLRGALPTCRAGGARAAAATRRRPPRSLWGHDSHGHFRTRASNSVITVRGTTWFVSDRCDGTLTRVTSGSVSVRDLHTGRTVVVHAGQRHLARRVG